MEYQIFLSWSHSDKAVARRVHRALEDQNWKVFWDPEIPAGAQWAGFLQRKIEVCACVVVLWSSESSRSFWVRAEAADGAFRDALVIVRIDPKVGIPPLFDQLQIHDLTRWTGRGASRSFRSLCQSIARILGDRKVDQSWFLATAPADVITSADLTLVHSTWRVPHRDEEFGEQMYRIHVIVHGHPSALERISRVRYFLEGWENERDRQESTDRRRNFELNDLAWGDFVVVATVEFRTRQPDVELTRFVNLTQEGGRLDRLMPERGPE